MTIERVRRSHAHRGGPNSRPLQIGSNSKELVQIGPSARKTPIWHILCAVFLSFSLFTAGYFFLYLILSSFSHWLLNTPLFAFIASIPAVGGWMVGFALFCLLLIELYVLNSGCTLVSRLFARNDPTGLSKILLFLGISLCAFNGVNIIYALFTGRHVSIPLNVVPFCDGIYLISSSLPLSKQAKQP